MLKVIIVPICARNNVFKVKYSLFPASLPITINPHNTCQFINFNDLWKSILLTAVEGWWEGVSIKSIAPTSYMINCELQATIRGGRELSSLIQVYFNDITVSSLWEFPGQADCCCVGGAGWKSIAYLKLSVNASGWKC